MRNISFKKKQPQPELCLPRKPENLSEIHMLDVSYILSEMCLLAGVNTEKLIPECLHQLFTVFCE